LQYLISSKNQCKHFNVTAPKKPSRGLGYWSVFLGLQGGSVIRSLPVNVREVSYQSRSTVVSPPPAKQKIECSIPAVCDFLRRDIIETTSRKRETRNKQENKEWENTENQWGLSYWTVLLGPLGTARKEGTARLFAGAGGGGVAAKTPGLPLIPPIHHFYSPLFPPPSTPYLTPLIDPPGSQPGS